MNPQTGKPPPCAAGPALAGPPPAVPALIVVIALGLYLVLTSAFHPPGFLSVFDTKRVAQLGLLAGLLVFTLAYAPLRYKAQLQIASLTRADRVTLLAFFAIGIASSLRLDHVAYALLDVSMMFVLLASIAVVAASRELAGAAFDRWAIVLLASMGFAVFAVESMGFIANWVAGKEFSYHQALIRFAHPRFYNQLQTWFLPVLAILPLLFPGKRWIKTACVALLGLQWFLVIMLAARGTVFSLFIAMAVIAIWLPAQRKHWLVYQLAGLLAGILIYGGVLALNNSLLPEARQGTFYANSAGRPMAHSSGRNTLWRLAIEDAMEHPVLGTGPTRYACNSNLFLPAHPHSFPLRILGEWGIIAFGLVVALILSLGFKLLMQFRYMAGNTDDDKDPPSTEPMLRALLAISLIAGFIHACLSGLFIMPASQVLMVLIAGWILSLSNTPTHQQKNLQQAVRAQQSTLFGGTVLVAGTIFSLAQLLFIYQELPQLQERTVYSITYGPMVPRFWQDGRACKYIYSDSQKQDQP